MKVLLAALSILASTASAVTPLRRLHFPRTNGTAYADVGLSRVTPSTPLMTGTSPSSDGYDSPDRESAPANDDDETVTATMTSVIHKTSTSYVHGTATPTVEAEVKAALPGDATSNSNGSGGNSNSSSSSSNGSSSDNSLSTTTVTSKTFTTVTISRGAGAARNSGAATENCAPSTVTVTQPPVTQTVFVTATAEPVQASSERVPVLDKDVSSFHKQAYAQPPITVQSVVTVMPFPTGYNGSHASGAARPTGFARLYRS
ncbi:hypothetical protein XA68_15887 [Ophiocordyceps unilateralis]|uniref:Uncharacterized protein n=1 Tax=Ophiocordyceps unilateralis TaxID=268505 RepID=A0A2A9PT66_OPHUN|nr:hypothetical protein XA68_15887 [Ophiocordyceps unilateralis]